MFGDSHVTTWGVAPNRFAVQPEQLGLGTIRAQVSGFLKVAVFEAEAAIKVFTTNTDLQNDLLQSTTTAINLTALQDMVKGLALEQVSKFVNAMGDKLYHCTMGVGSILVSPPGFCLY